MEVRLPLRAWARARGPLLRVALLGASACGARTQLDLNAQGDGGKSEQPTGSGGGPACAQGLCACPANMHACDGACLSNASVSSCGAACAPCPAPPHASSVGCDGQHCRFECDDGFAACGAACRDVRTDSANCGSCGHDCLGGACAASHCRPVALVSNQENPLFVAVDRANLYWTLGAGSVLTQPISGGTPRTLYSGTSAEGIAVDSRYVYWSTYTGGTILRMPLAGGPSSVLLSTSERPIGVAVDAASLYFTTFEGNLSKMPLAGGVPTLLETSLPELAAGVAVNGSFAFYGNGDSLHQFSLSRRGAMSQVLVNGKGNVFGAAVDATDVYWSDEYGGEVGKVSLSNGLGTTLISGRSVYAGGVAVDEKSVYWVASDISIVGSIMRLAK